VYVGCRRGGGKIKVVRMPARLGGNPPAGFSQQEEIEVEWAMDEGGCGSSRERQAWGSS